MKRSLTVTAAIALSVLTAWYFQFRHDESEKAPPIEIAKAQESSSQVTNANQRSSFRSEIYKQIEITRKTNAEAKEDKSNKAMSSKRYQEGMLNYGTNYIKARSLFQEALELDHYNVSAIRVLSGIALNEDNKNEARRLAADCIAIDRKDKECHATLISSYTRYGEFNDAYPVLSDCLQDTPNNIHCLSGMENYYLNANQLNEAKNLLDQILRNDPDSLWSQMAQASYFEKLGDQNSAAASYDKACKLGQPYACKRVKELANNESK